jgi:hypothetical protein
MNYLGEQASECTEYTPAAYLVRVINHGCYHVIQCVIFGYMLLFSTVFPFPAIDYLFL